MFHKMKYLTLTIILLAQNAFACIGPREEITDAYFDVQYMPTNVLETTEINVMVATEYKNEKLIKFELSGPGFWFPLGGQPMEFESGNKLHTSIGIPTNLLKEAKFHIGYGYTNCPKYYMVKKVEHNQQLKAGADAPAAGQPEVAP